MLSNVSRLYKNQKFTLAASRTIAALTACLVFYFAIFPARGLVYHDIYDTLYWAWASYESGQVIDPNFLYAAILPFGGSLLMLPFFPFFGLSVESHLLGMSLFIAIFLLALWRFCAWLPLSKPKQALIFSAAVLLMSTGALQRDNMWLHVIYYSLAILFCLLFMIILFNICAIAKGNRKAAAWKTWVWYGLLVLLSAGVATNGVAMLVLCTAPIIGCIVLDRLLDRLTPLFSRANRHAAFILVAIAAGTAAGTLLLKMIKGDVSADYAELNTSFSSIMEWGNNLLKVPAEWMRVFDANFLHMEPVVSLGSVVKFIRLGVATACLVVPMLASRWLHRTGNAIVRLVVCLYLSVSAVTLVFMVCSTANHGRRMQVMMFFSIIIIILYLLLRLVHFDSQRFLSMVAAVVTCGCLLTCATILRYPPNYQNHARTDPFYYLGDVLSSRGLTYGYADFYYSPITVLYKNEVKVRGVYFKDEGIVPKMQQMPRDAFDDQPGVDRYFVIMTVGEYNERAEMAPYKTLNEAHLIEEIYIHDHVILVYNTNPIMDNPPYII